MPIMSVIGYSGPEASYHLATHAFIFGLILTVLISTMVILEEVKNIREKLDDKS